MASSEVEAEDAQADFLFLRQLGQGASSVRIGDPLSIENSESSVNLLSISNRNGFLFAATNKGFVAHPLGKIRDLCSSSTRKESPRLDQPLRLVKTAETASLGSRVAFLRLADGEQKLLAGLANGRIAIWSVSDLIQWDNAEPTVIMQPPSAGSTLLELAPNPSDRPELCIALYGTADRQKLRSGTAVAFDVRTGQWGSDLRPANAASTTSLCWSVKGKQVVLGLDNGNLAQMTPEGEEKDAIPRPQGLSGDSYVEQVVWLENHVFFVTYNQAPSSEDPEHQCEVYTILRQPSTKTFSFVHFTDPAPPFGDTSRREHRFISWLKGWEPTKHMLFVASTSSTDVGLLGCSSTKTGSDAWQNLDLEDTSRPVLPFSSIDKDADTSPVALEVDYTADSNVDDPQAANRGEDGKGKLPPMPILYIYTNDGLLLAYTIVNTASPSDKYPGMVIVESLAKPEGASMETVMATDGGDEKQPASSSTNSFAAPTPASSTGGTTSAFGQASAFGQSSGFGGLKTDSAPAFGQSASIGNKSPSPFSFNPSGSSNSTSGTTPTSGFGAFASKPNNAFGSASTSFSFGTPSASAETTSPAPAFGGNSSSNKAFAAPAFGATSQPAFGKPSAAPAFGSSSAFGSTASAFGQPSAFGSNAAKSPFASTSTSSAFASAPSSSATTSGFGGFASKGSTFGASQSKDSSSAGSIFGSGGSLQTPSSSIDKPVFGQSLSSSSKPGPASLFASNATPVDKEADKMEEETAGGGGSLSFGGFGGLLGDGNTSTETEKKSSGFTFGSKQDATHTTTTTPPPFSFVKPQDSQGERSTPQSGGTNETSMKSAFPPSTTPTTSPVKVKQDEEPRGASNVPNDDDDASGDEDAEDEYNEEEGEESGDRNASVDEENEAVDDDDDYEDEDEEQEESEEAYDDDERGEEGEDEENAALEEKEEEKPKETVGITPVKAEPTPVKSKESDAPVEKARPESAEKSQDALDDEGDKSAEKVVTVKKELKSPTSFSFLPTNAAPSEPPSFSLGASKTTGSPSFGSALSSPSISTQSPSQESPIPGMGTTKNQGFLNFNSRAPRSSSPLSGVPVNRKDLPPSPVKPPVEIAKSAPFSFSSQKTDSVQPGSKEAPASKPAFSMFTSSQQPTTEAKPFSFGTPTPFQQAQSAPAAKPSTPSASTPTATKLSFPQTTQPKEAPAARTNVGGARTREATPRLSLPDGNVSMEIGQEQGLQALFLQTFLTMEKELQVLKENMQRCNEHQAMLKVESEKPLGVYDLSDESVWTFGELETKSKLANDLSVEAEKLAQDTQTLKISLKEMQSQQIKVDVKREEIAKFVRARNDPSFSKLVRVKQLGPEHAENQSKLRRATSAVREGVEELEAYLDKARKIRIQAKNGGQAALQAPSLDTIRRTARNITQSAQIKLIELQELEMNFDHLTAKGPKFSRSLDSSSIMADLTMTNGEESDVFDSLGALGSVLPASKGGQYSSRGSHHDGTTGNVSSMQTKLLDLKSVFLSGWKEPVLNATSKEQGVAAAAAKHFEMSDLDMAFAKGPVRVSVPPKAAAAAEPALTQPAVKPAASTLSFSGPSNNTTPAPSKVNNAPPSFSFTPLPSTALPKDAFQLPPEDSPFSPGGGSFGAGGGRGHHVSKFGGKRNTAVALPPPSTSALNGTAPSFSFAPTPSSSSTANVGKADFFATPQSQQNDKSNSSSGASAPSAFSFATSKPANPSFPSLGSAGLSSFASSSPKGGAAATTTPSLASRFAPVTFEGLQPMKPIAAASIDDDDDDEEEEDGEGAGKEDDDEEGEGSGANGDDYEDEEEGNFDDEDGPEEEEGYNDDDDDGYEDEAEEEQGLSDVVEGEEEE